jgi:hypothetical protein
MRGIRPLGWGLAGMMVTGGLVAGAFRLAGTQLSQPAVEMSVGSQFLRSESHSPKPAPKPTRTHEHSVEPTRVPTPTQAVPTTSAPVFVSPTESPHPGENGETSEHQGHGDD